MIKDAIKGRLVDFITKDRLLLNGFLVGPERSKRCIVYVHGMTGNFYSQKLPFSIADKVSRLGYSVFSINTRGHDLISVFREGKGRRKRRLVAGTEIEKFEDSYLDIDAALKKLMEMGFNKFILAGHSTGCQKVTYYQYKKNNRRVIGLLLLAPADDYSVHKMELGRRFNAVIRICKALVKEGKGNDLDRRVPWYFSPRRFLSVGDLKRVEARIFYYDGRMREFSKIRTPICAVFGSKEEYAYKPVREYLEILREKNRSESFVAAQINGATHSLRGYEDVVSNFVLGWLSLKQARSIHIKEIVEVNSKFPLASFGYS